jgi:[acyl-carrier-protein] S-malonyltransferase
VQEICQESGAEICNLNGAGQIVIGGRRPAVLHAMELARARGAAKVTELNVSGAFHSSLMRPAVEGMRAALNRVTFRDPEVPLIANSTAQPLTTGTAVREELLRQLTSAVQWQRTVELLARLGVKAVVEIGPGRVLAGLIRRIARTVHLYNLNSVKALAGDAP